MQNVSNFQNLSQTLFGPWPNPNQYREYTCRAIQVGIYAATYYKVSQVAYPLMANLQSGIAFSAILMHRFFVVLPYVGYIIDQVANTEEASKFHKSALTEMVIHAVALSCLRKPLIGVGALLAFIVTPILLKRAEKVEVPLDKGILAHDENGDTPLIYAVRKNCLEAIDALLEKGVDVNQKNKEGHTALYVAITSNHEAAFDKLLSKNPDLTIEDGIYRSCLDLALKHSWTMAKKLLDKGAKLDPSDPLCNKVLPLVGHDLIVHGEKEKLQHLYDAGMWVTQVQFSQAVLYGHFEIVKLQLDKSPEFASNYFAKELYAFAKEKNQQDIVKAFCEKNPSFAQPIVQEEPNEEEGDAYTLLEKAIFGQKLSLVQKYLERLTDIDEEKYLSCVLEAIKEGNQAILECLLKREKKFVNMLDKNNVSPLSWAAYRGKIECMSLLIEMGADLSSCNDHGETVLIFAVKSPLPDPETKLKVLHILLNKGADPNVKDGGKRKVPFIQHCIMSNAFTTQKQVQEFLDTYPHIDLKARDQIGTSSYAIALWRKITIWKVELGKRQEIKFQITDAIQEMDFPRLQELTKGEIEEEELKNYVVIAATKGNKEALVHLLQKNSNLLHRSYMNGSSLLGVAAYYGHPECVSYLIQQGGFDLESKDEFGHTVLLSAVTNPIMDKERRKKVVRILFEHEANPNARDAKEMTFLHYCIENEVYMQREEIKELLDAHHFDLDAKDLFCEYTPLGLAKSKKSKLFKVWEEELSR